MSYTEIYKVNKDGDCEIAGEARNAFKGAMFIWNEFSKEYLGKDFEMFFSQKTWGLQSDPRLSRNERIIMKTTFDNSMVRKANIPILIEAFAEFIVTHPSDNIKTQIEIFKKLLDEDILAICWNQTSVNNNPWTEYKEDTDEQIPYNINGGSKHWFVFDDLGEKH